MNINPVDFTFTITPTQEFTLTVRDVVEAIEKNGLTQVRGDFITYGEDRKVVGACAIGQAAVNLQLSFDSLLMRLNAFEVPKRKLPLGKYIIYLNDHQKLSFKEIGAKVREYFGRHLDATITLSSYHRHDYFE